MNSLLKTTLLALAWSHAAPLLAAWPAPLECNGPACNVGVRSSHSLTDRQHKGLSHLDNQVYDRADLALYQIGLIKQDITKIQKTPAEKVDYQKVWKWFEENKQLFRGPPGEDGKGETGPAGQVDYTKIWQWIRDNKEELIPPAPPAPPIETSRPSAVYVTSTKFCNGCAPVTAKVEAARLAGEQIAIVELDGSITGLTEQQKLTTRLSGVPAIHDFATSRSYVGAAECESFLATLQTNTELNSTENPSP